MPFMSVNMARRARALQTLRLPDDIYIPDTTQKGSYRFPPEEKYAELPSSMSMRPKLDDSLKRYTGDTTYGASHGLLASVVLEKNPFGTPREEPKYGRWKNPYDFTYRIN
ncbi:Uncharacterized protein OBRU01_21505, partial [Operophtera brumata]